MKNKKATGDYYERKVKKELEKQGYIVYKPVRTKWSEKDVFGLFDLIAYRPGDKGLYNGSLVFIQVKKNKQEFTKEIIKKLSDFLCNIDEIIVLLSWKDGKKMKYEGWSKLNFGVLLKTELKNE